MKTGISELSDVEIDEVSGGGVMYVLGFALGYSMVGAAAFYAELPPGAALL